MSGFLKIQRTEETEKLALHYPNAFRLLFWIAWRARRSPCPITGLQAGQCFLGDTENIGFSEQTYRTEKERLSKLNLATFKPTNKGTIATILSSVIYDINESDINDQTNGQLTDSQRTGNGRVTTNKKDKKVKEGEEGKENKGLAGQKISMPENLALSPAFTEAWGDWVNHRKEIKKPLTPTSINQQLKTFADWGIERSVASIRYTIGKGWQGLQEPSQNGHTNGHVVSADPFAVKTYES